MPIRVISLVLLLTTGLQANPAVLHQWLRHQASVNTLETTFTQERHLPSLKKPVTTPGKLAFARPGQVRWQLGDPPATLAISNGATITLIDVAEKTAHQIPADSPKAARFSMLTGDGFHNLEAFHQAFEIVEHRIDSGIHQYTLKPKDRRTRNQVPWIFLHIDPRKNQLVAMELHLKDKSRILTRFHNPRFNRKLPSSLFTADLSGLTVK